MPTSTRSTQTLFTEDLDVILEPREWIDPGSEAGPPRGSRYTAGDLVDALQGRTSALFESVEVKKEWGFIFPGEVTRITHLWRVTPETVKNTALWEDLGRTSRRSFM